MEENLNANSVANSESVQTEVYEEEYTFPNLTPTSKCKHLLDAIDKKFRPHKIIFWVCFGLFMAFMLPIWLLWLLLQNKIPAIIVTVLLVGTIITGIVNLAIGNRYNKSYRNLKDCIEINTRYSSYIKQGFSKKEAYLLTMQWLDGQATAALNNISAMTALSAMSHLIK